MSIIKDVVILINAGWRLFEGEVDRIVYEKQGCPSLNNRRISPKWFFQGDKYLCVGCAKKCSLVRPAGFQASLPLYYREDEETHTIMLSVEEMLSRRKLLKIFEVAYCINSSERYVRYLIDTGVLRRTEDRPVRVPSEDVIQYIESKII